jgi:hypothetical protein
VLFDLPPIFAAAMGMASEGEDPTGVAPGEGHDQLFVSFSRDVRR